MIEFAAPGPPVFTYYVSDQAISIDTLANWSAILTGDSHIAIDHRRKTYYVQPFDDLLAQLQRKLKALAAAPTADTRTVELTLTSDISTIAGCRARRVTRLERGKPRSDMWFCKEWVPLKLAEAGEKLLASLPLNYWAQVGGEPGSVELTMLHGMLLREQAGERVIDARVTERSVPDKFKVPAGYQQIPPPK